MVPTKACPVVLQGSKLLVFRHPSAGIQLVKGTIESGEGPEAAALRELREESGIADAAICEDLGLWDADYEGRSGPSSFALSHKLCQNPGNTDAEMMAALTCASSGTRSMPGRQRSGIRCFSGHWSRFVAGWNDAIAACSDSP